MRPPRRAAAVGLAVLGTGPAACGSGSDGAATAGGALRWVAAPQVFRTAALPDDRVAVGTVRNTTRGPLRLSAAALVVRTADGRPLNTTGQYAAGYAHGLYGAYQKPDPIPPGELARLGRTLTLAAGATAPLAVSWRLPRHGGGAGRPAVLDYGRGRLVLPTRVRQGAGGV